MKAPCGEAMYGSLGPILHGSAHGELRKEQQVRHQRQVQRGAELHLGDRSPEGVVPWHSGASIVSESTFIKGGTGAVGWSGRSSPRIEVPCQGPTSMYHIQSLLQKTARVALWLGRRREHCWQRFSFSSLSFLSLTSALCVPVSAFCRPGNVPPKEGASGCSFAGLGWESIWSYLSLPGREALAPGQSFQGRVEGAG